MNLKISVERPSGQRMPRKPVRENRPVHQPPRARKEPSAYGDYAGEQRLDSLRHQQIRRVPPPARLSRQMAPEPGILSRAFSWLRGAAAPEKQLRVLETVPLGEKRSVSIIEAEGRRFLVGCGASGVRLLTRLDEEENCSEESDELEMMGEPVE